MLTPQQITEWARTDVVSRTPVDQRTVDELHTNGLTYRLTQTTPWKRTSLGDCRHLQMVSFRLVATGNMGVLDLKGEGLSESQENALDQFLS